MTWKHVVALAIGAAVGIVGAVTHDPTLYTIATGVITGTLGNASPKLLTGGSSQTSQSAVKE